MDVVTIGETMVLFTPEAEGSLRYSQQFSKKYGGAESNVAIGLARLGHQAGWISKVGNDEFGKGMLSFIRGEGVDVHKVLLTDEAPTGMYFKEHRREGMINVYYYRKGSAASRMKKEELDRDYIGQAKYLHITGITPALSESCRETVYEAIKIAKEKNVKVVFDPNLRRKLWEEDLARGVLLKIASEADIILPGIEEGQFMFGVDQPEEIGKRFLELGASIVVLKIGAEGSIYFTENEIRKVPGFPVKHVVDPVGAGDGFAAGFLSGMIDGLHLEQALTRANAVGALVTMVKGDVEGLPDRFEIEQFISNNENDVIR
ncbi:sugar kinase [Metabacillus schmidteae]|uniref:sugar kinase n=1 Tax=Metabacillus schmidteae TaxID=2730405 RepID=UPI00158E0D1F|nr:sugar kinase [Metabacillus schmidteae]